MILRGYGNARRQQDEFRTSSRDVIALGATLLVAVGFVAGDIIYRHGAEALLQ